MGKQRSGAPRDLGEWIDVVQKSEASAVVNTRAGGGPARLWSCVSNYYVKTLAGWQGSPLCDPGGNTWEAAQCVGGVGPAQLEVAKNVLGRLFHVVLLSEWLDHPAQIEWLGRVFCFPTEPRRSRDHKKLGTIPFPNMARKSAPGGHSSERPLNWRPTLDEMSRLEKLNALDLDLFSWAADRTRSHLAALNASRGEKDKYPPLPALTSLLTSPPAGREREK